MPSATLTFFFLKPAAMTDAMSSYTIALFTQGSRTGARPFCECILNHLSLLAFTLSKLAFARTASAFNILKSAAAPRIQVL